MSASCLIFNLKFNQIVAVRLCPENRGTQHAAHMHSINNSSARPGRKAHIWLSTSATCIAHLSTIGVGSEKAYATLSIQRFSSTQKANAAPHAADELNKLKLSARNAPLSKNAENTR